ncbi:MAG TPA: hypothetical protein V6C97_14610 [Oculatellaceae cyanobacterium]
MLDVRVPIAWLFLIFGAILVGYGLFQPQPVELSHGMFINLNRDWGILMGLFGLLMAGLIKLDSKKKSE